MKKSQRWNIMATTFMCLAAIGLLFKLNIWITPVSTVCMFVALYYQIRNEDIEKLKEHIIRQKKYEQTIKELEEKLSEITDVEE